MLKFDESKLKNTTIDRTEGFTIARVLLLVSLVVTLTMYIWMSLSYKDMVRDYRFSTPSNIKQDVDIKTFSGYVSGLDLEKEKLVFKTDAFDSKFMLYLNQMDVSEKNKLIKELEAGKNTLEIKIDVNEKQFRDTHNQYDFDYQRYLFSQNIIGQFHLKAYSSNRVEHKNIGILLACEKIKALAYTREHMPEKIMMYFNALVLGENSFLSEKDLYRSLGVSHVFAISGMHFGFIYLFLNVIIKCPLKIKRSLILMVLFVYWGLVGFTYSAGRAVMLVVYIELARAFLRKVDVLSAVAFTNIILLLIFPKSVLSVSYQLSFIAYLIIAYFYQRFYSNISNFKPLRTLHFTLFVQIVFMPIQLYYFGEANVFSFLSNLILVPLISILFPLLFMVPVMGILINGVLESFILVIESFAGIMPKNLVHFQLLSNNQFNVVLILAIFYFTYKSTNLRFGRSKLTISMSLVTLVFIICGFSSDVSEIHFIDVGHGDAALIIEGQYKILIDTGDAYSPVIEILNRRGINRLNAVILTHAHDDHIGGLNELLKVIKVDQIYCNEETLDKIRELLPQNSDVIKVVEITELYFDENTLKLMPIRSMETNDNAIAIEYRAESIKGIFLGDISGPNYENLPFESEAVTFVKVSHHGSKTGLSKKFIKEHKVDYAVISHSEKYLMPNREVVDLLSSHEVIILDTYRMGGIKMSSKGVTGYFNKDLD